MESTVHRAASGRTSPAADAAVVLSLLAVPFFCLAAISYGQAGAVKLGFPALVLIISVVLLQRAPLVWVSFVLWVWMLTPWLRRLIDERVGWDAFNPILIAPYLATGVGGVFLLRRTHLLRRPEVRPFGFVLAGVGVGFLVGVVRVDPWPAFMGLADWLLPVLFGFAVACLWRTYPLLAKVIVSNAVVATAVLGAYGLVQFFLLPGYDRYWMKHTFAFTFGLPFPQEVRVFGTMNSPGPFAFALGTLCLLLLARRHWLVSLVLIVGLAALGLTLVRSAWLGLVAGVLVMVLSARPGSPMRRQVAVVVAVPVILLATQSGPIAETVTKRVTTVSDLSEDQSFQDRSAFLGRVAPSVVADPLGQGIGSTGLAVRATRAEGDRAIGHFDNGLMEVPFALGLAGAVLYLSGAARFLARAFRSGRDPIRWACAGVCASAIAQSLFGPVFQGSSGIFVWMVIGLSVAARLWDADRRRLSEGRLLAAPAG